MHNELHDVDLAALDLEKIGIYGRATIQLNS